MIFIVNCEVCVDVLFRHAYGTVYAMINRLVAFAVYDPAFIYLPLS